MNRVKELASPLTVVGFLLFLLDLAYLIYDYESVSLSSGQGWGLLVLGALWIPAAVSLIVGLIVKAIFKRRKTRMIVDTVLFLLLIIVLILSYEPF